MPSTVTPVDAVSRCSPYCVLELYLRLKKKREGGKGEYLVLDGKHRFLAEWFPFATFISNPTRFFLCVKRKVKAKAFSFVALNCTSSSDGLVGGAGGRAGQRSCVNGVNWRPVKAAAQSSGVQLRVSIA